MRIAAATASGSWAIGACAQAGRISTAALGWTPASTSALPGGTTVSRPPWTTATGNEGSVSGSEVVRKTKDDFKSGWFALPGADKYAAVNSHFFTQAIMASQTAPNSVTDWEAIRVTTVDAPDPLRLAVKSVTVQAALA